MHIHCIYKGYVHIYTYVLYIHAHNYIAYAVYKCTVCIFTQMCAYTVYTVESCIHNVTRVPLFGGTVPLFQRLSRFF